MRLAHPVRMIEELIAVGNSYDIGGTVEGDRVFLTFGLCLECAAVHIAIEHRRPRRLCLHARPP